MRYFLLITISLLFVSCSTKTPVKTTSAMILFKTKKMKFYDLGFIAKYDDKITVNILNAGHSVLKMDIYKDRICRSTFECISSSEFNKQYLSPTYKPAFLYDLFNKEKIYFKDNAEHIFIKVINNI